jgi:very-short-patch-repair endonuclease
VLRTDQLTDLGLTHSRVRRWTAAGHLHRPHRGVYTLTPLSTLAPQGRELAAVWACGEAAVLGSVSAAVRWGMLRFAPPEVHVLMRSTGRRSPPGVRLHVTNDLPPGDVTVREQIPVTTVERTVLDLAAEASVSDRALESAAAQAERDGRLRRPAQLRTAARAHHRAGAARLRTILRDGPRVWRSDEEAAAAVALVEAGLPEPVIAHEAQTDIGRLEVDLSFPAYRLILEVDGGQHALTLNAARDVARDAALARAGWHTLRVAAATVRERPQEVVRIVAAALGARGYRAA